MILKDHGQRLIFELVLIDLAVANTDVFYVHIHAAMAKELLS